MQVLLTNADSTFADFFSYVNALVGEFPLTGSIFETGAYGVPSKLQNPTILGQCGPFSTQCSNPSWACCWRHPIGISNYPAF